MNRNEVFRQIRARGGVLAKVQFSGGNDEGGADDIVIEDEHGTRVADIAPYAYDNSPDQELADALMEPMEAEYGGFATEGGVSGTYTWDARTGKVTLSAQHEEWVDQPAHEV